MIRIKITGKKVRYNVTLKNRITVVTGRDNMYIGRLVDLLVHMKDRPGYRFEISGSDMVYTFRGRGTFRFLESVNHIKDEPSIYLLDNNDLEQGELVRKLICEAETSYFVLFTQNIYLPGANYSMSDVYEMRRVDGWQTLVPAYPERIKTEPELREWYASLCRDKGCGSIQFV